MFAKRLGLSQGYIRYISLSLLLLEVLSKLAGILKKVKFAKNIRIAKIRTFLT